MMGSLLLVLRMSLRNIRRNIRRTVLMVLAVGCGIGSSVMLASIARGISTQMLRDAIYELTGHVQIQARGYVADPVIENRIEDLPEWQQLRAEPGVRGLARRVRVPFVITSERELAGVTLVGIDPREEREISFVGDGVASGAMLVDDSDKGIVIGKKLAERLSSGIGKRVVLVGENSAGNVVDRGFKVIGIFDAELESTELAYVFVSRNVARDLLGAGQTLSEVSVTLADQADAESFAAGLRNRFPTLDITTWRDREKVAVALRKVQDGFLRFWFGVVISAVSLGLMNTLFMSVLERVHEFGVLKSLGVHNWQMIALVLGESFYMICFGACFGNAAGLLGVSYFSSGIDISGFSAGAGMAGIRSVVFPRVLMGDILYLNILVLVIGMAAGVLPALRVARYSPTEALRG